jgi:hypothetical protein
MGQKVISPKKIFGIPLMDLTVGEALPGIPVSYPESDSGGQFKSKNAQHDLDLLAPHS